MSKLLKIDLFEFEPYCFLEGGTGLNDCEQKVSDTLYRKHITSWILDDLYDKPERLIALKFLKPKTIFLGTTGVYQDKVNNLKEVFKIAEHIPDNIVFTIGDTETNFWELIDMAKATNPKVRFFDLYPMYTKDDDIQLIELKHL